jgi:hypothetical protein
MDLDISLSISKTHAPSPLHCDHSPLLVMEAVSDGGVGLGVGIDFRLYIILSSPFYCETFGVTLIDFVTSAPLSIPIVYD